MEPTKPRHKTRFVATATVYTPPETEQMEACASLDKLRALLPAGIVPEEHPTLLFAAGNLAVGGVCNANDDALTLEDTIRTHRAYEWQLVDIEHSRGDIKGFIIKAGLSELGTDRLITPDEARAAGKPVNVAIVIALWKVADKELCDFIRRADAPASPDKGKLSFSFEVGFDDYDVVVLPKGASNLALATMRIAPGAPEFEHYDKILRVNGGKGVTKDGRVARIIMGNIVPLGAGIVTVPAAAVKGLTTITENPHVVESDASVEYPYGSKCPECGAPTSHTERRIGPDAMEGCKNGHSYLRRDAVRVETDAGLYKYSSTQCSFNETDAAPFRAYAAAIPDAQIYTDPEDPTLGRESTPHVTCLYGIVGADPAPIAACLAGFGPVTMTMGKVAAFEMGDAKPYDVLIVDVDSPDLHRLHALIKTTTATETKWPEYRPHCTISYMRKGMTRGYIGDTRFEGTKITFSSITFSPHTGDRVEIALGNGVTDQFGELPAQSDAAQVYSPSTPSDLASAMASPTTLLPLSAGWQAKLAALGGEVSTSTEGKVSYAGLPYGVDITLSDGRVLKGLTVHSADALQMPTAASFEGVVITNMTPGVGPQADSPAVEHPAKVDVYPTCRPEKVAAQQADLAAKEAAQHAGYTSAALDLAFARINTALASVSSSNPTPPPMKLEDLKQSIASVKTVEELPAVVANVALFAEEIAKASEQMANERKAAQEAATAAQTSLSDIKAQLATLTTQHTEMVAAQAAAAAEAKFNERMASIEETFALDDEIRPEIVDEVKTCADDAAFAKWLASAKKKMKGWLKKGEKPGDKKDDKEPDDDADDAKAAVAAKTALASAKDNIVDAPITNNLEVNDKSLRQRYEDTFAANVSIGGVKVKDLNAAAKAKK